VHNTITINNQDQMTRAGKFLWLDWAQAQVEEASSTALTAVHFGYKRLGVVHQRRLERGLEANWIVSDELLAAGDVSQEIKADLNWLMPDWPWELQTGQIRLQSPLGLTVLAISSDTHANMGVWDIFRAGESLLTGDQNEIMGWYSPTYGLKQPALSIRFSINGQLPMRIRSVFYLPA
jgi:hypothetical protein